MKFKVILTNPWVNPKVYPIDYELFIKLGFEPSEKFPSEQFPNGFGQVRLMNHPIIDIQTIDELVDFADTYGEIVMGGLDYDGDGMHVIEIYNDYRE